MHWGAVVNTGYIRVLLLILNSTAAVLPFRLSYSALAVLLCRLSYSASAVLLWRRSCIAMSSTATRTTLRL